MFKQFKAANREAVARGLFTLSMFMLAFAYGVMAEHYGWFPVAQLKNATAAAQELLEDSGTQLPWYYQRTTATQAVRAPHAAAMAPGLTLVSGLGEDELTEARVVDASGAVVHKWVIDWFKIWPQATHLPADVIPKSNAGLVHGIVVADNGDLVFSFEKKGMVRMDPCGGVVWKLPYRTHHSVHLDEGGNIWTAGVITRNERRGSLPNYDPPFDDHTVVQVSPDGRILQEISLFDVLAENELKGLLYLSTTANLSTRVTGDTLHLNDVEIFPASMPEGVFKHGDVMVSLRNVNTVIVFDPGTRRVKFVSVGKVLRQHDPDFVDGNTISIFDNNNLAPSASDSGGHYSRIVRISATQPGLEVRFAGTKQQPFFSYIMGKHQLLENGNTLITEAIGGRVFEIDANGTIVWEYLNLVGNGMIGAVDDAVRLAPAFDKAFFARAASACHSSSVS